MEIIRKSCARGAEEAEGLTIIIDVFRAFSCAPLFFHFGAKRVILNADPEKALGLKRKNPQFILVGEINEVPIEGADLGNSPSQIIKKGKSYFKDKTVIHRTTAGVTGVSSAYDKADEIILGSFVMAKAVAAYIKKKNPDRVTLVAMGERAQRKSPEDETCADYLEYLLAGRPYDPAKAFKDIVFQQTAQKFIQGTKKHLPKEDPVFCLQRDLFHFVLTVKKLGDQLEVFKQNP
jgi:2-phosphosulfolactate phosphatase